MFGNNGYTAINDNHDDEGDGVGYQQKDRERQEQQAQKERKDKHDRDKPRQPERDTHTPPENHKKRDGERSPISDRIPTPPEAIIPVDALATAFAIAKAIYEAAKEIRANNTACDILIGRIEQINKLLENLGRLKDNLIFKEMILKYNRQLNECSIFINDFAAVHNRGFLVRSAIQYYRKDSNNSAFENFNVQFDRLRSDLVVSLNLQTLYDLEDDKLKAALEFKDLKEGVYKANKNQEIYFQLILRKIDELSTTIPVPEDKDKGEELYETGRVLLGQEQHLAAFNNFIDSDNKGCVKSKAAIGMFYLRPTRTGNVVDYDPNKAANLLYQAAVGNDMRAQFDYAKMLEDKVCEVKDDITANEWYIKAAENGLQDARERCDVLRLEYKKTTASCKY